jgi:hypothetical protein
MNSTIYNSNRTQAQSDDENDVALTLSLDLLLGEEFVMIIHLPPIEMDVHTSFVAYDPFDANNVALREPKLARAWTDQNLVVNQTLNLVINSALDTNRTQWHADRLKEIVEASVRQDPVYLFIQGDRNANTTQLTQRVLNEAGALRVKISYDETAKDSSVIQNETYSVTAQRFAFAGWRDNTVSWIVDLKMDLDFGVFGTIPPFTIDVFTDASRMVTVMVPQFEIGYATRPLPEGGQNVSTLVQFYAKRPTHDVWASADLLTCGRVDEYGNRTQTYDIFDIGLRGTGSTDYTTVNSSDFQFMTSLLRGVQIEMLKKNGSDYVCVNNEYVV